MTELIQEPRSPLPAFEHAWSWGGRRQHANECQGERFSDEIERASRALGRVSGRSEGAELCARSIATLRERGVVNPEAEIGTHFPELLNRV